MGHITSCAVKIFLLIVLVSSCSGLVQRKVEIKTEAINGQTKADSIMKKIKKSEDSTVKYVKYF